MIPAVVVAAAVCAATVDLPPGITIELETIAPISSRTGVVGDRVDLRVATDVMSNGVVAVPRGSTAVGEISDARRKGVMGMAGRLTIRPLYVTVGDTAVRVTGAFDTKGSLPPGTVAGLTAATALGALYVFTGRSAAIPAGTRLMATVVRPVHLSDPCRPDERTPVAPVAPAGEPMSGLRR